jgi:ADP-dependent phosphofructokinase/glucokinase
MELDEDRLKTKKTKQVNKLFDFEKKSKVLENLDKIEVEDRRVVKTCDTHIISAKTVEILLKYFDLEPGMSKYD